jgi:hypothetical protein
MRAGLIQASVVEMHQFTTAVTSGLPLRLSYLPVSNSYLDAISSFCKMTMPYPGYRIVAEVYMKYIYICIYIYTELLLFCWSDIYLYNKNDNLCLNLLLFYI